MGSTTATASADEPREKPQVEYIWGDAARKNGWWWGTGRRKTAVARVRIRPGNGELKINKRDLEVYFSEDRDRNDVLAPLQATNTQSRMDVHVNVNGGGYMGQAQAIRLGIARALKVYDCSLEQTLRDNNFLTRDARAVERKKPGQPGARKRFQFSKR
ncbi:MAG: 30S ribosomal protein S9 [Planctomycetes bacterium]|nr:30S ribosomal protein S9 [Planctomycetota bacterium]NOG54783.1 30S ribosomal protein S9 [Planctomycetota bacterium]